MRKRIAGGIAMMTLVWSSTALAQQATPTEAAASIGVADAKDVAPTPPPPSTTAVDDQWQVHGFADISAKTSYVTVRGLVVHTQGAAIHVLNGLSATAPGGGMTVFGTVWADLNPGGAGELMQEFDFSVGASVPLTDRLTGGVEYMQYTFPEGGPKDLHNLEFSLKYADPAKRGFAVNPHVKLFWALPSGSSTVALGKAGKTFDVELGMTPTYANANFTLVAPTWITVGPKSFWGVAENGGDPDGHFGLFSTGLKAILPIKAVQGGGTSVYGQAQYYHFINDNLVRAKALLNRGESKRDQVVLAAGLNVRF